MRLLIVEDDPLLGDGLSRGLGGLGFAVDWITGGAQADAALATTPYDAIVLDLGLPGDDGLLWLARWRQRSEPVPVVILTARDGVEQRIAGLDGAANDYLIKPIETGELAARLRTVTRRSHGRSDAIWQHGALEYLPGSKSVRWRGEPAALTARESALLRLTSCCMKDGTWAS